MLHIVLICPIGMVEVVAGATGIARTVLVPMVITGLVITAAVAGATTSRGTTRDKVHAAHVYVVNT